MTASTAESESMIDKLNQEELLEIFEYLDAKSLKDAALVCKQWDTIIGTSTTTMRKLPLAFRASWPGRENEIAVLGRKFHTIILESIVIDSESLAKVMSKVASNVQQFVMDSVDVTHESFKDVLSSLKSCKKLTISSSHISSDAKKTVAPTSLAALKTLVFLSSDWTFVDYLIASNTQVMELKLATSTATRIEELVKDKKKDEELNTLESFLSLQTGLDTLCVRNPEESILKSLAKHDEKSYKFKLKNLHVSIKDSVDPLVDADVLKLLGNHQATLEIVEAHKCLSEAAFEFVVKSLKLKKLSIQTDRLPTVLLFYNAIRPNIHLKTLIIEGYLDNLTAARGLFHLYPSIQALIIEGWDSEIVNEVLILIANSLKHLKYLEIPELTSDTPELPNPSLKSLRVNFVRDVLPWQTFVMNNPSLEIIAIKWLSTGLSYEILDAVTTRLQNLKHIKFGTSLNITLRMLEVMSRNCRSLKLIESPSDEWSEQGRKPNVTHDQLNVIYYPSEAVPVVFKPEPKLWKDDLDYENDSEFDGSFSGGGGDDMEWMQWNDGNDFDDPQDFDDQDDDDYVDYGNEDDEDYGI